MATYSDGTKQIHSFSYEKYDRSMIKIVRFWLPDDINLSSVFLMNPFVLD